MDETRVRLAKAIGVNIRVARKLNGLSQRDLAAKLLTTQATVSDWEQGRKLTNIDTLYFIGKVLGASLAEMLTGLEK